MYVDDILLIGNSSSLIDKFIGSLAQWFSLKDLGSLHYFLGVKAFTTPDGLFLPQQKYIHDFLHRTNMLESKDVSTPMSSTEPLCLQDGSPLADATEYGRIVGAMQYLSLTWPDISFAVNKLSQFMHHWSAVKRVLRYLKGTCTHGILIRKSVSLNLHAFADVNWVGDVNDRTSTSSYLVFLLIGCKIYHQSFVSSLILVLPSVVRMWALSICAQIQFSILE